MVRVCLCAWPKQFGQSSVTDGGFLLTFMPFMKVDSESMLPLTADLLPKSAMGCLVTILSMLFVGVGLN